MSGTGGRAQPNREGSSADQIVWSNCNADDHLRGERRGEVIHSTGEAGNLEWDRDPSPRCPAGAGLDVRPAPLAVWEQSRGNQLSTVALRTIYLCPHRGASTPEDRSPSASPARRSPSPSRAPKGRPGRQ